MTLEKQVCSLELSKRLKELGVKQESLFWWIERGTFRNIVNYDIAHSAGKADAIKFSAFTVAELGEMFPDVIRNEKKYYEIKLWTGIVNKKRFWAIGLLVICDDRYKTVVSSDNEADARAKMLVYLIENGLITLKQV